jgi:hypothetical protein
MRFKYMRFCPLIIALKIEPSKPLSIISVVKGLECVLQGLRIYSHSGVEHGKTTNSTNHKQILYTAKNQCKTTIRQSS